MRESQPVLILDRTFSSKAAAIRHCKKMINARPVGSTFHGRDDEFFRAVIKRHPYYDLKAAKGVKALTVSDGSLSYGTYRHGKGLCIIADDGSKVEISVKKCFAKESREPIEQLNPKQAWIKGGGEVICEYQDKHGHIKEAPIKTNASQVILLSYKGNLVRKISVIAGDGSEVRSFEGHYRIQAGKGFEIASPNIAQLRTLMNSI